jgi:16S rRNA (guanine(966)-N(2))-methyltransferase RsmD
MRIIAGRFKGRTLRTPSWEGLRPTSDRLRETLFNVLAADMPGARVLDVYAGTGAVGLEALSRGARAVTFIEQDRRAVALIRENLARCAVSEGCAIVARDAAEALRRGPLDRFDIVFLDPPYDTSARDTVVQLAAAHVADDGVLVLEYAHRQPPPPVAGSLALMRTVRQGDSALAFYRDGRPSSSQVAGDA